MPWRETNVLEQRRLFISRWQMGVESFTELCEEFGIPRKTGYKWRDRYIRGGLEGLNDLSRRPKQFRQQVPNEIICEIVRIRQWKPSWGGRKIRGYLAAQKGISPIPHARTIDRYLRSCGFVTPRPQTWRRILSSEAILEPKSPNDVWTVDHKGWWRTGNGRHCEPLTVIDRYSRMVLNLSAHKRKTYDSVKSRFGALFEEFGLPSVIRMDNGVPFASVHGLHRLTRFSLWLLKLGVIPNRMDPASPHQNGSHERFHRDIKRELQSSPAATLADEQNRFDLWRHEYNHLRPHEALGDQPPISVYQKSERKFSPQVTFEYPPDFLLRKITSNGALSWKGKYVQISKAMAGDYVGLEDCDEPFFKVWYCDFYLGTLGKVTKTFTPSEGLIRKRIGRRIIN